MTLRQKPLTVQELTIMKVVWGLGEATVRQVYEILRRRKRVAYTTVMTVMGILESKGHLSRRRQGRAYVYTPVRAKQQVIAGLVDDFVGRVLDGSARPLLLGLARDRKLSADDLEAIRQVIEAERVDTDTDTDADADGEGERS